MNFLKIEKPFKIISSLNFGMSILGIIAVSSSIGSFIEQDESLEFYIENYSKPIYGFIDSQFIFFLGLNHIYTTWWFLLLLGLLAFSLISCTIIRQFPLLNISKEYFFKKKRLSYTVLPFSVQIKKGIFIEEIILQKLQNLNYYSYQKKHIIYSYQGLIGRISPILVHVSLLIILISSTAGAFFNFKAQEILPKGELFHIQNPIKVGTLTPIPQISLRINDFWVEYKKNQVHQYYSNLSLLNDEGIENIQKTISVNNPLKYKNIDFYQSDWNLIGLRFKELKNNKIYEVPIFKINSNSWVTWLKNKEKIETISFNSFKNILTIYDEKGNFITQKETGELIFPNLIFIETLPSTGLLIKYDPMIPLIYIGFGLLMITSCLSYLPYNQIWIFNEKRKCWIGSTTNRGQIKLEISFENLIRILEKELQDLPYTKKNKTLHY